ncbi:hypothetical protein P20429_1982 [Pseudoalteromonas sp. BSi20429]|nr:hypothetical protein P20429_1982 [Pseudoalteromonas sp. BSi20429]
MLSVELNEKYTLIYFKIISSQEIVLANCANKKLNNYSIGVENLKFQRTLVR